jgi:hypothetical protein
MKVSHPLVTAFKSMRLIKKELHDDGTVVEWRKDDRTGEVQRLTTVNPLDSLWSQA